MARLPQALHGLNLLLLNRAELLALDPDLNMRCSSCMRVVASGCLSRWGPRACSSTNPPAWAARPWLRRRERSAGCDRRGRCAGRRRLRLAVPAAR